MLVHALSQTPVRDSRGHLRFLKLPPASVVNKVIGSVCSSKESGLVLQASDLIGIILRHDVPLDWETIKKLSGRLMEQGQVRRALLVVDDWLQHNGGQTDRTDGERSSSKLLRSLLSFSCRIEDEKSITGVLERMSRTGVSPSPKSIASLMHYLSRIGKLEAAFCLLGWMKASGMQEEIDSWHYQSLLTASSGMAAADALAHGRRVFEDMLRSGIQPTAHFFAAYLSLCCKSRDSCEAERMWKIMLDFGVQPEACAYHAVLDVYARTGDESGLMRCYEKMRRSGTTPDAVI